MRPHGRLPYAGNFHFHSILNKIWLLLFGYSEMGKPMVEENFEQARNSSKMSMADSERVCFTFSSRCLMFWMLFYFPKTMKDGSVVERAFLLCVGSGVI
ncbi:hypothetical protein ACFX2I_020212 [Malus domestica]